MNGTETTAYAIASMALAASCVAHGFASRDGQRSRQALSERLGTWTAVGALLALLTGLVTRAILAGRWPLGTTFEFTLAFAASVVLLYLLLRKTAQTPLAGATATLLALLLVLHALFVQPETARAIQALPPVMRGPWFILHTLLTALAYGALTVAGGVALPALRALSEAERSETEGSEAEGSGVSSGLRVTAFVDRTMAIGYIALSLGMISGGIWGELAWGEYWTWSTKEAWTLATWLACTFYYHVRHRRGWRGRRAMCIAVLTTVTVWVSFFLTPTLLQWTRLQQWRIY